MNLFSSVMAVGALAFFVAPTYSQSEALEKSQRALIDFGSESVGAAPKSFVPVVGHWSIDKDGDNLLLKVDGTDWSKGQTATGIADRARAIYGERYAEFLDNVKAFAYFPYAVALGCDDFEEGEITMRFKTLAGKIDQGAGILFNLKPDGDYLAIRANPLENNLVLWKFAKGKRTSVKWIKEAPTTSLEWHELKLVVSGKKVSGFIDGKRLLEHDLEDAVSGKVGIWTKADSVVWFDDYCVKPSK